MDIKRLILIIYSMTLLGCGVIATKGDLKEVIFPQNIKYRGLVSITYSGISIIEMNEGVSIINSTLDEESIEASLISSKRFSKIIRHRDFPTKVDRRIRYQIKEADEFRTVPEIIDTDYFLEVVTSGKDYGPHGGGYMHWGLLHFVSLGFIPMYFNNDISYKVRLFDSKGKLLKAETIKDESSIWAWTPLILFNGFKVTSVNLDERKEVRIKAMNNLLKKLEIGRN